MYSSPPLTADVPAGVVRVTFTVPADCAGAVTLTWLEDTTVIPVAATVPNITLVVPDRLVP